MYDVIFRNANIADGSGMPLFRADAAVKDGRIARVGEGLTEEAARVIECGKDDVLAPGFFDVHTHNDILLASDPYMTPQLLQGVTFDVSGNCGQSASPVSSDPAKRALLYEYSKTVMPLDSVPEWRNIRSFGDYRRMVEAVKPKINYGNWIGQGTVRIAAMGMDNRPATADELAVMKNLVREAMESGAMGLSTGLIYAPGVFTPEDEIIELAKVVGEYGGVYATHMRNESGNVVQSVEEAIRIARAGGCKLLVSHHKVVGKNNAPLRKKTLALMDKAREEGMTVMADQYLFSYGSTMMSALFPPKYLADGVEGLLNALRDKTSRDEACRIMETDSGWENFLFITGADGILLVSCSLTPEHNNKNLDELAAEMHTSPAQAAADIFLSNNGSVLMAVRLSEQEVIDDIWRHPFTAAGSDGIGAGFLELTHPRAYSAFVRIFQEYVRERKVVSLEEAVRKCTSLPASFLGIKSKGLVREGLDADLVLFNKETIGSEASFAKPRVAPTGVEYVMVGGKILAEHGKTI